MIRPSFISQTSINGQDMTKHISNVNGVPVVATLPVELRGVTPSRMESHERGYTYAGNLFVDASERVWINADAFIVREFDTYYCIAVRRVDDGVTVEIPDNIRFTGAHKSPFEAVLPVLSVEVVPAEE